MVLISPESGHNQGVLGFPESRVVALNKDTSRVQMGWGRVCVWLKTMPFIPGDTVLPPVMRQNVWL